jgi:hypothetical protein
MRYYLFGGFRAKVTIAFILSLFFVAVLSNFLLYKYSYNSRFSQLREELEFVAQTAALGVDEKTLMQVPLDRKGIESPEYKEIAGQLRKIKNSNPQIVFIYTMTATEGDEAWQFIVDPDPSGREKREDGPTAYPGDTYDISRFPDMKKAFERPSADTKLTEDEWGVTLSGYAPIRDESGRTVAILGIDIVLTRSGIWPGT